MAENGSFFGRYQYDRLQRRNRRGYIVVEFDVDGAVVFKGNDEDIGDMVVEGGGGISTSGFSICKKDDD